MDPITAAMIISGGIAIAGKLIGAAAAAGDRETAAKYRELALKTYGQAAAPQLDNIVMRQQGETNLRNEDPRLKGQQMDTMSYLTGQGAGSLDAQANADLAAGQADAARFARGAQGAVDQRMAARGMGGSGLEYLGQMVGAQGAVSDLYNSNTRAAADQSARRLDAMKAAAGLAGGVRGQDMQVNRAQDEIDRFNTESLNKGALANSNLQQQRADNDLRIKDRQYKGYRDSSQDFDSSANQTEDLWNSVGEAGSNTASATAGYMNETGGKKKKE